jgi:DNA-binding GntR family transcriptional regulator
MTLYMKVQELFGKQEFVNVEELCRLFSASKFSIRRDLMELERKGILSSRPERNRGTVKRGLVVQGAEPRDLRFLLRTLAILKRGALIVHIQKAGKDFVRKQQTPAREAHDSLLVQ